MADIAPIANPPIGPLGLIGNVPVPNIETRSEEQLFKDINTPTGLKPVSPDAATPAPVDPFAGFQEANFNQFQEAPDQFANFKTADDLDLKSVDELNADRENFHPSDVFANNPDLARDPSKLSKLLSVYRKRDEEGLTAKGVAQAAIKNTPGLVADIAGGIKRLGERTLDVTVQPVVTVLGSLATGDLFDKHRRESLFDEAKKSIKKGVAEVGAGSEAATVGLVDLARTGAGKLPQFGKDYRTEFEPLPEKKPKTDQELLAQLSDDASFRQNAEAAIRGEGEAAKNFGLDKDTLAKQGITLDENAIKQLSLVDPITMVATGGAFKLVGLGGKVLGVARTLEGAQSLAGKLADVAQYSAGKTIQGAGKALTFVGEKGQGMGRSAALITGIGAATHGAGPIESLAIGGAAKVAGPAVRKVGGLLEHAGKAIAGEVPVSANLQKVLDYGVTPAINAGKAVGKGALEGLAAGAPFALAAQDDQTAGALLGAGTALGAAGAVGAGAFRVVKEGASRRFFGENRPILPDVASPGYGKDAALDAQHDANIAKFSAQDASELNNFREVLRQQGGEIYAVDQPTFRQKVAEAHPELMPEQIDTLENHSAFFDTTQGDRKVVYLNSDTRGLRHDAGHIFDAILSPEKRAELRTAVEQAFTPEQRQKFRDTYERQVGSKISDKAAVDEFIAEQFAALFNNVPVTDLAAPKSLLSKFVDTAAEAAETLGIDLTNGATTPNLGAPVSIGIRQIFRNAAGDVVRANIEGVPATNVTPFPGGGPTPPPAAPPVSPKVPPAPAAPTVPPPPPGNVVPLPGAPARNIRVGPEDVAAFKQSATPDVRAAADARARETGVDYARTEAKKDDGSPTSQVIEKISDSMESGRPVVQIDHLGITSESTPEAPLGRTARRGEQSAGYAALEAAQLDVRQNAPPEIVSLHSKNFVPIRWTDQGGSPTLIAMSLDKVISNMLKVAADPKAKDLIPYPVENGKFTPEGWREVVADAQAYSENQANGRKGDGGRLEVPEAGLSIPAENPAYTPQPLSPERANFQNLVQGLAPPLTSRSQKGVTPGNVKGQVLAEANRRPTETPANISGVRAKKQEFAEFPGRTVQETNPLRNELERRGVKTRELIEVTERIRAKDIVSAEPRPDVNYKAPVTDIIRGGFLPAPTEFRQKNLGGRTVEEFSDYVLKSSPTEWKAATDNMTGGLTGGAWNLGLGLKDAGDVAVLKSYQAKLSEAAKAAMTSGDFDAAYSLVSKGQFFREAYEAATGTGSAGAAFKRGTAGTESAKPPFPIGEQTTEGTSAAGPQTKPVNIGENGQFLPRTDAGRAAEKRGFEFKPFGEAGSRGIEIFDKDHNRVGEILSEEVGPNEASIQNVIIRHAYRGKGIGEAVYRELAAQLKEDGVTKVVGTVVAPEPLALRRKVFGGFDNLEVNGQPSSVDNALSAANLIKKGVQISHIEPVNRITADSRFLPAEELPVGETEKQQPEVKVVPAAAGAGTPPPRTPLPPQLNPPPIAAGFQPKKDENPARTGKEFTKFFSDVAAGKFGKSEVPFTPLQDLSDVSKVEAERMKHWGNFENHIQRSIPMLHEEKTRLADGVIKTFGDKGARMLDIGSSEGDFGKAISALTDGKVETVSLDPNPQMAADFKNISTVKGATHTEDAFLNGFEDAGKTYAAHNPAKPYDLINEAVTFQFMDPNRDAQVAEVKRMLAPDGVFTTAEKFRTEDWAKNEAKKDTDYKDKYFTKSELKDKEKRVGFQQSKEEEKSVGMVDNMVTDTSFEDTLKKHFKHVVQYWDSGNFKGYAASDNKAVLDRFVGNIGDLNSEFSNVQTPRVVEGAAGFQPKTEAGRKLEERGYEIVPKGEYGMREVSITKDGEPVGHIDSVQRTPKMAEVAMVVKYAGAPKGIGEVLYRELGAQLKEDGVTQLEGNVIAPQPLAIRKKIFGKFKSLKLNDEPSSYEDAIAAAERIQNHEETNVAAIEPVNTISENTRFMPKVNRDAQGRPLDKNGDIDYKRWQAEGIARRKQLEAEPITPSKSTGPKAKDNGAVTGWILPDKSFVPLDTNFHEQYLADNAADLNKKFNTDFSDTASVEDRLAALNAGFVRLRNQNGQLSVEVNAAKFPGVASKLRNVLQDREGQIDGLTVSLLNNKGLEVDSTSAGRLHELSGPERMNAISDALDTLRGGRFLPAIEEYWMDSNGKMIPAPSGHEKAAKDILRDSYTGSKIYDEMFKRGYTRIISNEGGLYVDSNKPRFSDMSSAQRAGIEDALLSKGPDAPAQELTFNGKRIDNGGAGFLPSEEGLPGIGVPSVEELGRAKAARRIATVKKNNPEAVIPQYARDEEGKVIVKPDGTPKTVTLDYNFADAPVSKEAAKGLKGAEREAAATAAVGDKLVDLYKKVEKNADIKAGAKWYSTARTRLKKVFGDDSKFFAELLGATSARTPVDINYRFALDAYNQFKAGAYDDVLAKYREGKKKWDEQDLGAFKGETRGQFLDYWVDKHNLGVTQSNGKKFGMNSRAVLRVLDGSWASEVQGPKTPNFAGNLTGETYESTIDIWAARTISRMANDGKGRWRILPDNETGVTDRDFYFGQAAYRHAAQKLGIKPDALQAVLWFAEKDFWEKNGWTRGAGAEKSDFNVLLNETERTPSGKLQMKSPQAELGLDTEAELGILSKKKK